MPVRVAGVGQKYYLCFTACFYSNIFIFLKMSNSNDWKRRLNIVYSTNPDFKYDNGEEDDVHAAPKEKQQVRIKLDKRNRGGKTVTLITGIEGSDDEIAALATKLKSKIGTGGSAKEGEIIIQGDFRNRVMELLLKEGYAKCRII